MKQLKMQNLSLKMSLKIIVIGSGISSLSSASFLAKEGHEVTIIEKNDQIVALYFP